MYFLRRLRPLEVAGERVRMLRVSLNAPVLSAADLPVGPARAVIVVHREARGRMDASVGVRSQRGGEIAYWSFDGELTSEADLDVAADAALTFSESLGFLFDEEALSGDEAEKAFRAWLGGKGPGLTDPEGSGYAARAARVGAESTEVAELELEDLVVEEPPPVEAKPAPAPKPAASKPAAPPARPAAKVLSKFRGRDAEPGSDTASGQRKTPQRQPLARVQLVKRRSPEEERKLLLRKLLTSF